MSKLKQIAEGWKNNLTPAQFLDKRIKEVADERISICEQCEFHSKYHFKIRPDAYCTNCGCTLSAKTKCLTCECPLKKWLAVEKEENENN
jgi:putative sterol carrier protein